MSGFFGLEWTQNATIEVIIEAQGFNNSLAGYDNCKNANSFRNTGGLNATKEWVEIYLQDATKRFQSMVENFDWTIEDTYAAQTMCPYETVCLTLTICSDRFNRYRLRMGTVRSAICSHTMNGLASSILTIYPSLVAMGSSHQQVELWA